MINFIDTKRCYRWVTPHAVTRKTLFAVLVLSYFCYETARLPVEWGDPINQINSVNIWKRECTYPRPRTRRAEIR